MAVPTMVFRQCRHGFDTIFSWINPCGYQGLATIDMRSLGSGRGLSSSSTRFGTTLERIVQRRRRQLK